MAADHYANKLLHRLAFTLGLSSTFRPCSGCSRRRRNHLRGWVMVFFSLLDDFQPGAKFPPPQLPLKGLLQGIKLSRRCIGILIISLLIGQSPAILISGLGAMAAVLMLVLDPILGTVAGINASFLGDWLEMPKYGRRWRGYDNGLTTVKCATGITLSPRPTRLAGLIRLKLERDVGLRRSSY